MNFYAIFDKPIEFPASFVIRRFSLSNDTNVEAKEVYTFDTLENAREYLNKKYPHLICFSRHQKDDPSLIETWL